MAEKFQLIIPAQQSLSPFLYCLTVSKIAYTFISQFSGIIHGLLSGPLTGRYIIVTDSTSIRINSVKLSLISALFALFFLSCASVSLSSGTSIDEKIQAENRILKKNLTLALRENSVIKDENIGIKDENTHLKSRIKLLESEIESLNKKHAEETNLLNRKYDNLSRKNEILEKESSTKIQQLTQINKSLEEKLSSEITRLTDESRKQEERFNRERLDMETVFAGKEMEYRKEIAALKNGLLAAKTELESMRAALDVTDAKLKAAIDDAESVKLKLAEIEKRHKAAENEIAEKNRIIENLKSSAGTNVNRQEDNPAQ